MLEIQGRSLRLCDGISRRSFIKIGSLGLAGLSLPEVLRASQNQPGRRNRAVILYWMAGGPSHIDTYDMKPDAPTQVRGPFRPGATRVPGMRFNDLFTRQAPIADKFSLVRSLAHSNFEHMDAAHWVQTGYHELNMLNRSQVYPAQGSIVSMMRGPNHPGMPAYVCIPEAYGSRRGFYQKAAFLGSMYDPLNAGGAALSERYHINQPELILGPDMSVGRLQNRRQLQHMMSKGLRSLESSGAVQAMDSSYQRAFDLVTSTRVQGAFDFSREPVRTQEKYGRHAWGQAALLARRLVEAGVTFVTINHFEAEIDWWDDHYNIETNLRKRLPLYDQALGTLIEDLHDRGLADDVLVAAFGEFGRGPVISDRDLGRSHWARAWHALLSGGGVQGGRVIGATTPNGGEPTDRRFGPSDLLATIYHSVGIDHQQTVTDRQNRPIPIAPHGEPIRELF